MKDQTENESRPPLYITSGLFYHYRMSDEGKKSIYAVFWRDAAYSFNSELPPDQPITDLTVGFIISENENFINIATNVDYDHESGRIKPADGFLIPRGTIIKITKAGILDESWTKN